MKPIPLSFIRERTCLSWSEAAWGYHSHYLGWPDVVDLACDRVGDGEDDAVVVELAGLSKSDLSEVGELLDKLKSRSQGSDDPIVKAKWLYLALAWLFENQASSPDAFDEVEAIYCDFDYPKALAPFVPYMPTTDGYDPSVHSKEENHARLIKKWKDFLDANAAIFKNA